MHNQMSLSEITVQLTPTCNGLGEHLPWESDEQERLEDARIYHEVHGHNDYCLCNLQPKEVVS